MGAATQWLGPSQLEQIARELLGGNVADRQARPGEVMALCPLHGDTDPSFGYSYERDVFYCFGCGASGDIIELFGRLHGLDESEAFKKFKSTYAPNASSDYTPRPKSAPAQPRVFQGREASYADGDWTASATRFVDKTRDILNGNPAALRRLADWGITEETAGLCRLGYNDRDRYEARRAWGLPEAVSDKTGKPKKLWLPQGFVIPFYESGRLVKTKIRADDPFDPKLRYYAIPGGSNRLSVYGNPAWLVWFVVETERDACLIWQEGRPYKIGCVGAGSASARPDTATHEILSRADLIVVALDSDEAGLVGSQFWLDTYPQTVRGPVPPKLGKDAGDLPGGPVAVADWMRACLPHHHARIMELPGSGSSQPAPCPAPSPAPTPEPRPVTKWDYVLLDMESDPDLRQAVIEVAGLLNKTGMRLMWWGSGLYPVIPSGVRGPDPELTQPLYDKFLNPAGARGLCPRQVFEHYYGDEIEERL